MRIVQKERVLYYKRFAMHAQTEMKILIVRNNSSDTPGPSSADQHSLRNAEYDSIILVDEGTGHAAAVARGPRNGGGDGAAPAQSLCSPHAPEWMTRAIAIAAGTARGARPGAGIGESSVLWARPRQRARFERARAGDAPYARQLDALALGLAADFALRGSENYLSPEVVVRVPMRGNNGCFARAALHCLARVADPSLWAAAGKTPARASDLSPAAEELAKAHVRQALHTFATTSDVNQVMVIKHIVGHVLVRVRAHMRARVHLPFSLHIFSNIRSYHILHFLSICVRFRRRGTWRRTSTTATSTTRASS